MEQKQDMLIGREYKKKRGAGFAPRFFTENLNADGPIGVNHSMRKVRRIRCSSALASIYSQTVSPPFIIAMQT